jgi:hypothetical protein
MKQSVLGFKRKANEDDKDSTNKKSKQEKTTTVVKLQRKNHQVVQDCDVYIGNVRFDLLWLRFFFCV